MRLFIVAFLICLSASDAFAQEVDRDNGVNSDILNDFAIANKQLRDVGFFGISIGGEKDKRIFKQSIHCSDQEFRRFVEGYYGGMGDLNKAFVFFVLSERKQKGFYALAKETKKRCIAELSLSETPKSLLDTQTLKIFCDQYIKTVNSGKSRTNAVPALEK